MNYREAMDDAVEFIEAHLTEQLTARQLADRAGYSLYHFCRVFSLEKGIAPMEYIRRRRLAVARFALAQGGGILETAIAYGYETASGFAKSFRREFGYSPGTYAARMRCAQAAAPSKKGVWKEMKPFFVQKDAFKVAGYGIQTNVVGGQMRDIAAYWDNYQGENLESKMYAQLNPPRHGEVGLCVADNDGGQVTYLLGVIVENDDRMTPDMISFDVPAAKYAVFTTPEVDMTRVGPGDPDPLAAAVKETWRYIFEVWFPVSGYVYDESKVDFEFYDERCHGRPDTVMEIYVPVLPKK